MDPLTIGLLAGGAYLLTKGGGAAGGAASTAAESPDLAMPIAALMGKYRGAYLRDVPAAVHARLKAQFNAQIASGNFGTVLSPVPSGGYLDIGARWDKGDSPPDLWSDWSKIDTGSNPDHPRYMAYDVNFVHSNVFQTLVAPILRVAAPIVGTIAGGPVGTAAGAAASKALGSFGGYGGIGKFQADFGQGEGTFVQADTDLAQVGMGITPSAITPYVPRPRPGAPGPSPFIAPGARALAADLMAARSRARARAGVLPGATRSWLRMAALPRRALPAPPPPASAPPSGTAAMPPTPPASFAPAPSPFVPPPSLPGTAADWTPPAPSTQISPAPPVAPAGAVVVPAAASPLGPAAAGAIAGLLVLGPVGAAAGAAAGYYLGRKKA